MISGSISACSMDGISEVHNLLLCISFPSVPGVQCMYYISFVLKYAVTDQFMEHYYLPKVVYLGKKRCSDSMGELKLKPTRLILNICASYATCFLLVQALQNKDCFLKFEFH